MRLQIDMDRAETPQGVVRVVGDEDRPEHAVDFEGWVGLIAVLRELHTRDDA